MATWRSMAGALLMGLLVGCMTSETRVGLMSARAELIGVKVLRPGILGRSCRASVLGLPLEAGSPSLVEALERMHAQDSEGDVVTDAQLRWSYVRTGIYNRSCVEVRGDLGRAVTTVLLPVPGHGSHAHH